MRCNEGAAKIFVFLVTMRSEVCLHKLSSLHHLINTINNTSTAPDNNPAQLLEHLSEF